MSKESLSAAAHDLQQDASLLIYAIDQLLRSVPPADSKTSATATEQLTAQNGVTVSTTTEEITEETIEEYVYDTKKKEWVLVSASHSRHVKKGNTTSTGHGVQTVVDSSPTPPPGYNDNTTELNQLYSAVIAELSRLSKVEQPSSWTFTHQTQVSTLINLYTKIESSATWNSDAKFVSRSEEQYRQVVEHRAHLKKGIPLVKKLEQQLVSWNGLRARAEQDMEQYTEKDNVVVFIDQLLSIVEVIDRVMTVFIELGSLQWNGLLATVEVAFQEMSFILEAVLDIYLERDEEADEQLGGIDDTSSGSESSYSRPSDPIPFMEGPTEDPTSIPMGLSLLTPLDNVASPEDWITMHGRLTGELRKSIEDDNHSVDINQYTPFFETVILIQRLREPWVSCQVKREFNVGYHTGLKLVDDANTRRALIEVETWFENTHRELTSLLAEMQAVQGNEFVFYSSLIQSTERHIQNLSAFLSSLRGDEEADTQNQPVAEQEAEAQQQNFESIEKEVRALNNIKDGAAWSAAGSPILSRIDQYTQKHGQGHDNWQKLQQCWDGVNKGVGVVPAIDTITAELVTYTAKFEALSVTATVEDVSGLISSLELLLGQADTLVGDLKSCVSSIGTYKAFDGIMGESVEKQADINALLEQARALLGKAEENARHEETRAALSETYDQIIAELEQLGTVATGKTWESDGNKVMALIDEYTKKDSTLPADEQRQAQWMDTQNKWNAVNKGIGITPGYDNIIAELASQTTTYGMLEQALDVDQVTGLISSLDTLLGQADTLVSSLGECVSDIGSPNAFAAIGAAATQAQADINALLEQARALLGKAEENARHEETRAELSETYDQIIADLEQLGTIATGKTWESDGNKVMALIDEYTKKDSTLPADEQRQAQWMDTQNKWNAVNKGIGITPGYDNITAELASQTTTYGMLEQALDVDQVTGLISSLNTLLGQADTLVSSLGECVSDIGSPNAFAAIGAAATQAQADINALLEQARALLGKAEENARHEETRAALSETYDQIIADLEQLGTIATGKTWESDGNKVMALIDEYTKKDSTLPADEQRQAQWMDTQNKWNAVNKGIGITPGYDNITAELASQTTTYGMLEQALDVDQVTGLISSLNTLLGQADTLVSSLGECVSDIGSPNAFAAIGAAATQAQADINALLEQARALLGKAEENARHEETRAALSETYDQIIADLEQLGTIATGKTWESDGNKVMALIDEYTKKDSTLPADEQRQAQWMDTQNKWNAVNKGIGITPGYDNITAELASQTTTYGMLEQALDVDQVTGLISSLNTLLGQADTLVSSLGECVSDIGSPNAFAAIGAAATQAQADINALLEQARALLGKAEENARHEETRAALSETYDQIIADLEQLGTIATGKTWESDGNKVMALIDEYTKKDSTLPADEQRQAQWMDTQNKWNAVNKGIGITPGYDNITAELASQTTTYGMLEQALDVDQVTGLISSLNTLLGQADTLVSSLGECVSDIGSPNAFAAIGAAATQAQADINALLEQARALLGKAEENARHEETRAELSETYDQIIADLEQLGTIATGKTWESDGNKVMALIDEYTKKDSTLPADEQRQAQWMDTQNKWNAVNKGIGITPGYDNITAELASQTTTYGMLEQALDVDQVTGLISSLNTLLGQADTLVSSLGECVSDIGSPNAFAAIGAAATQTQADINALLEQARALLGKAEENARHEETRAALSETYDQIIADLEQLGTIATGKTWESDGNKVMALIDEYTKKDSTLPADEQRQAQWMDTQNKWNAVNKGIGITPGYDNIIAELASQTTTYGMLEQALDVDQVTGLISSLDTLLGQADTLVSSLGECVSDIGSPNAFAAIGAAATQAQADINALLEQARALLGKAEENARHEETRAELSETYDQIIADLEQLGTIATGKTWESDGNKVMALIDEYTKKDSTLPADEQRQAQWMDTQNKWNAVNKGIGITPGYDNITAELASQTTTYGMLEQALDVDQVTGLISSLNTLLGQADTLVSSLGECVSDIGSPNAFAAIGAAATQAQADINALLEQARALLGKAEENARHEETRAALSETYDQIIADLEQLGTIATGKTWESDGNKVMALIDEYTKKDSTLPADEQRQAQWMDTQNKWNAVNKGIGITPGYDNIIAELASQTTTYGMLEQALDVDQVTGLISSLDTLLGQADTLVSSLGECVSDIGSPNAFAAIGAAATQAQADINALLEQARALLGKAEENARHEETRAALSETYDQIIADLEQLGTIATGKTWESDGNKVMALIDEYTKKDSTLPADEQRQAQWMDTQNKWNAVNKGIGITPGYDNITAELASQTTTYGMLEQALDVDQVTGLISSLNTLLGQADTLVSSLGECVSDIGSPNAFAAIGAAATQTQADINALLEQARALLGKAEENARHEETRAALSETYDQIIADLEQLGTIATGKTWESDGNKVMALIDEYTKKDSTLPADEQRQAQWMDTQNKWNAVNKGIGITPGYDNIIAELASQTTTYGMLEQALDVDQVTGLISSLNTLLGQADTLVSSLGECVSDIGSPNAFAAIGAAATQAQADINALLEQARALLGKAEENARHEETRAALSETYDQIIADLEQLGTIATGKTWESDGNKVMALIDEYTKKDSTLPADEQRQAQWMDTQNKWNAVNKGVVVTPGYDNITAELESCTNAYELLDQAPDVPQVNALLASLNTISDQAGALVTTLGECVSTIKTPNAFAAIEAAAKQTQADINALLEQARALLGKAEENARHEETRAALSETYDQIIADLEQLGTIATGKTWESDGNKVMALIDEYTKKDSTLPADEQRQAQWMDTQNKWNAVNKGVVVTPGYDNITAELESCTNAYELLDQAPDVPQVNALLASLNTISDQAGALVTTLGECVSTIKTPNAFAAIEAAAKQTQADINALLEQARALLGKAEENARHEETRAALSETYDQIIADLEQLGTIATGKTWESDGNKVMALIDEYTKKDSTLPADEQRQAQWMDTQNKWNAVNKGIGITPGYDNITAELASQTTTYGMLEQALDVDQVTGLISSLNTLLGQADTLVSSLGECVSDIGSPNAFAAIGAAATQAQADINALLEQARALLGKAEENARHEETRAALSETYDQIIADLEQLGTIATGKTWESDGNKVMALIDEYTKKDSTLPADEQRQAQWMDTQNKWNAVNKGIGITPGYDNITAELASQTTTYGMLEQALDVDQVTGLISSLNTLLGQADTLVSSLGECVSDIGSPNAFAAIGAAATQAQADINALLEQARALLGKAEENARHEETRAALSETYDQIIADLEQLGTIATGKTWESDGNKVMALIDEYTKKDSTLPADEQRQAQWMDTQNKWNAVNKGVVVTPGYDNITAELESCTNAYELLDQAPDVPQVNALLASLNTISDQAGALVTTLGECVSTIKTPNAFAAIEAAAKQTQADINALLDRARSLLVAAEEQARLFAEREAADQARQDFNSRIAGLGRLDTGTAWTADAGGLRSDIDAWLSRYGEQDQAITDSLSARANQLKDATDTDVMPTVDRCIGEHARFSQELDSIIQQSTDLEMLPDNLLALQGRIEGSIQGLESFHAQASNPHAFKALLDRLRGLLEEVAGLRQRASQYQHQQEQQQQDIRPERAISPAEEAFNNLPADKRQRAIRQWAANLKHPLRILMADQDFTLTLEATRLQDDLDNLGRIKTFQDMEALAERAIKVGLSPAFAQDWTVFLDAYRDIKKRGR